MKYQKHELIQYSESKKSKFISNNDHDNLFFYLEYLGFDTKKSYKLNLTKTGMKIEVMK